MNFLDEDEIITTQAGNNGEYTLSTADNTLQSLINEANGESAKVTDEIFGERQIPDKDFPAEDLTEEQSPEENRAMQSTSLFIVETADEIISRAIAAYAHCNEAQTEKLKGSPAQLKKIARHFAPYFGTDNLNLPPWVMGAIAAGILLFDKFQVASEMRKINLALEAEKEKTGKLERENKALQLEIDVMRKQKETEKLKDEINKLKGTDEQQ